MPTTSLLISNSRNWEVDGELRNENLRAVTQRRLIPHY